MRSSTRPTAQTARTIRFPSGLRSRLLADAERCGRSFEAQVLAILRRHYGEDVDLAPSPDTILGLAVESIEGIPQRDRKRIEQRLGASELK